jgi:hypothetical protein
VDEEHAMTIAKTRSLLYTAAKAAGDYQAVKNGRIGQRLVRRAAGKLTARLLGRLL